jgi:hypothetical protein
MPSYEMPVVVRMSREEVAASLGRAADDPEVQRLGGLNLVLHPMGDAERLAAHPTVAATPGAADEMRALAELLRPVEEQLFQRLRSNPALGKRFIADPAATLDELGLLTDEGRTRLRAAAATLSRLGDGPPAGAAG